MATDKTDVCLPLFLLGGSEYKPFKNPGRENEAQPSFDDEFDNYLETSRLRRSAMSSPERTGLSPSPKPSVRQEKKPGPKYRPPTTFMSDTSFAPVSSPRPSEPFSTNPNDEDETWTTVFGFPPEEIDRVVEFVQRMGQVKHIVKVSSKVDLKKDLISAPAGPTWIHVQWKTTIDAQKALGKLGTIMTSGSFSYMLGIIPYRRVCNVLTESTQTWQASPPKPARAGQIFLDTHDTTVLQGPSAKTSMIDKLLEKIMG